MSVSISSPVWDKLKAKLSQLSPLLFGQLGSILGAFAVVIYLQTPQLAALKQQHRGLSKADLQQAELMGHLLAMLVLVAIVDAVSFAARRAMTR